MKSHERYNSSSDDMAGESAKVTESEVTEPGLQADSPSFDT
jgi:hypothetical protein